jgi:DNA-binding LacI/PurR family transcriptional regulator
MSRYYSLVSNPDGRRVRLRDVAERAGVSVGSASQAFGRPELVSEEVRKRVLEAARVLGYPGPDPAARRLRTGRAGAVGLIFAERLAYQFTDPASPAFLRGVALGMEEEPTGLLLIPDSRDRDQTARTVSEAAVDGFLIYSTPQNDPRVEAALARRLPVVTVDQPRGIATPFVGIDDRAAARSAANYVRELGHERVAVLSFITAIDRAGTLELDLSVERLKGYKEGLDDMWDATLVRTCRPNAAEPARRETVDLLRGTDPPTAILAMSDILALGALDGAAQVGVSVPDELSVVGFDDSPAALHAIPPLTTVAQPQEEKGRLAARWLMEEIEHGWSTRAQHKRAILPTELVVRESTAPHLDVADRTS